MFNIKKITTVIAAAAISFGVLTGCTSQDKTKVEETAQTFIAIVASDSEEDINKYASMEVAGGDFVQLFSSDSLADKFVAGFDTQELTDETKAEVEQFCSLFDGIIEDYSISKVEIAKDGTATAIATIKTKYAVDIISSEDASEKINEAIDAYYTNNEETITALYEEGEDVAQATIYNDMIRIVLQIYEDEIASSSNETYAIALTLEKNADTDSWIVTNISDYNSSSAE